MPTLLLDFSSMQYLECTPPATPKGTLIPIPHECAEKNDGRRTYRTRRGIGRTRETDTVKPVVRMADPVNAVVRRISYADVVK